MNRFARCVVAGLLLVPAGVDAQTKKILDHDAYEIWKGIDDQAISNDGRWALYTLTLQDGDAELVVREVSSEVTYSIPRGSSARFTANSRFVVTLVQPEQTAVKEALRQKKKPDEQPKDSLVIVDLTTGDFFKVERVKGFAIPEESGEWVAYLLEKEPAEPIEPEEEQEAQEQVPEEERKEKKDNEVGTALVVRDL
ncbi:MAG: hypothetical protein JSW51_10725, partial [Gemmatimonadota bacterium]